MNGTRHIRTFTVPRNEPTGEPRKQIASRKDNAREARMAKGAEALAKALKPKP